MIKDKSEMRKYYFHGMSHPIGLDVHDVGGNGSRKAFEPGMVITIEPGIYVKEEAMGIRIEDDILITEDGYINLSSHIPKTIEEIEKVMAVKGLEYDRYIIK